MILSAPTLRSPVSGTYGSFRPIGTGRLLDQLAERTFLPANEACHDVTPYALDQAVLRELLEIPESVLASLCNMRLQLCARLSVHGGKVHAPKCSVS